MNRITPHRNPQSGPEQGRLRVARIGKPHGVRGEVTVELFTDEPEERLKPGVELIREPAGTTVNQDTSPLIVASRRWNKQICLLKFTETPDRDAAEALRGCELWVSVEDAHPDDAEADTWYSHDLEGLSCLGVHGQRYGRVAELLTGEAQDLLVVTTEAGEDVMVPFVEELVPEVDIDAGIVRLNPPGGLF